MRRACVVCIAIAGLAVGPAAAHATNGTVTGKAQLHQHEESGVKGRVTFEDDGETLTIRGTASGLDPTVGYVSLLYDTGSVPGGPSACLPSDDSLSDVEMIAGAWVVDPAGNGTLEFEKSGDGNYVGLDEVGTISIRVNDAIADFPLRACGQIS